MLQPGCSLAAWTSWMRQTRPLCPHPGPPTVWGTSPFPSRCKSTDLGETRDDVSGKSPFSIKLKKSRNTGKTGTGELWVARRNTDISPAYRQEKHLALKYQMCALVFNFCRFEICRYSSKRWDSKTSCLWSRCVLYLSSLHSLKKH